MKRVTTPKPKKKKRSNACFDFERAFAADGRAAGFEQTERIVRGFDWGESTFDVFFPEIPHMITDTKYREGGWAHHSTFETEIQSKYLKKVQKDYPDAFCVMPTKSGRKSGYMVSVDNVAWWQILQLAFLNGSKKSSHWQCPRCAKPVEKTGTVLKTNHEYTCSGCKFRFVTQEKQTKETV